MHNLFDKINNLNKQINNSQNNNKTTEQLLDEYLNTLTPQQVENLDNLTNDELNKLIFDFASKNSETIMNDKDLNFTPDEFNQFVRKESNLMKKSKKPYGKLKNRK